MAEANKRALSGKKQHKLAGEHKIPIEDRKAFMHHNVDKWVGEKKFDKYLKWKEERRK